MENSTSAASVCQECEKLRREIRELEETILRMIEAQARNC